LNNEQHQLMRMQSDLFVDLAQEGSFQLLPVMDSTLR
jgi:hypothetical protein